MTAEILDPKEYPAYEAFVKNHPHGGFTQSVRWPAVKANWGSAVVVVRDDAGTIVAGAVVLIQKLPVVGFSMLYAPRGPVCDLDDEAVLAKFKEGVDQLARRHRAYLFKMDPEVLAADTAFIGRAGRLGFTRFAGPEGFETIQARFNYHLWLEGRDEAALFANLTQKTRYNIRVAIKHGVEIRVVGAEYLDEFARLMETTGERDSFSVRPKSYFARMLSALGEDARLYMGFYEGHAVCGAIAVNFAGKTCYVYGASDNLYRNVMPNYLMQWEMIRWAVQSGCQLYDFQGVSGILEEGHHMYGLYRFKRGFNGTLEEYAGEFDYVYRPAVKWVADTALRVITWLREARRRGGARKAAE